MEAELFLSTVAGIIFLCGSIPYTIDIMKNGATPQRATWILFFTLDILGLSSMAVAGTVNGQIVCATIGAFITMMLSVKYGGGGWTRLDRFCFAIGLIGIVILLVGNEKIALAAGIFAGTTATLPTFKQAWYHPQKESRWAWSIFFLSCFPTLASISDYSFMSLGQPITFISTEGLVVGLLWIRWRPKRHAM